jgi:hypothetical protein
VLSMVTRLACDKIAQNVIQPFVCRN